MCIYVQIPPYFKCYIAPKRNIIIITMLINFLCFITANNIHPILLIVKTTNPFFFYFSKQKVLRLKTKRKGQAQSTKFLSSPHLHFLKKTFLSAFPSFSPSSPSLINNATS
eukprot:UN01233